MGQTLKHAGVAVTIRQLSFVVIYVSVSDAGQPLHEAMGQTLKHAGVAVTITSVTDVFAFAIGSITVRTF